MIDVLLILLVFFMVTSSFLNLDMIRLVDGGDTPSQATAPGETAALLRVTPGGAVRTRGQVLAPKALVAFAAARTAADPMARFLLLPAPRATTQDLVTVMEALTRGGATRLRVIRLEAQE